MFNSNCEKMRVDLQTYETKDFTCPKCGWEGKGQDLAHGEFSVTNALTDLECPNCWQVIAQVQG